MPPGASPAAAADSALVATAKAVVPSALRRDFAGGMASAATNLGLALSLGILAFAPLGPAYFHVGVYAGFAAAIWGHLVAGLFGGAAHPGSGPRPAATLILASLVAVLAADPALAPSATQGPGTIVAIAGATVVLAGVLQIVLGAFGAGNSARFVPYPFVAGFMCGASALIIIGQLAPLAGIERADIAHGAFAAWRAVQPATLFVGLATAATIWAIGARAKRLSAPLIGLLAGSVLYYAIALLDPAARLGPVVGAIPGGLPFPIALLPLSQVPWDLLVRHGQIILTTAGLIAFIGTVDGLFAAVAIDNATDGRHKTKREVVAHGLANVVSGMCGGVPVVLSRSVALASWNAGGRSPFTTLFSALLLAFALTVGGRLLGLVPMAVVAGLMVTLGLALIDNWTTGLAGRLRRKGALRESALLWSLATVVVVAFAEVLFSFMPAIGVGFQLSGLLLYLGMKRSLVRSVVDGNVRPSRRVWGGEDAERVRAARQRIRVIELEGALFFASAERLIERVEPLAGIADVVILDFRRVTVIDATGALLIESIARRLSSRGTRVLLAGVTPQGRHGATLIAHDAFRDAGSRHWFRDADQAVEWAERAILEARGHAEPAAVPLAAFPLLERLSPEELKRIEHHFVRRDCAGGEVLFQENDPGDRLCLLARGAVEISIIVPGGARARIVTNAEGSLFGEMALLDGRPRSASAQAVGDAVVFELTRTALDEIAAREPEIMIRLMTNLAKIQSIRMRETNEILRQLEDSRG
ncbi:MAG: SulP family inorganic anion transporter [Casimicrobiaceae bacterium]